MTQQTQKVKLGQPSGAAPEAPNKGKSNITFSFPGKDNPLIVKLVCDPTYDNGNKVYRPARYFTHPVGTKATDKRRHICNTFFGAKTSPENDAYWEAKKALSALKKEGKYESAEGKRQKMLVDTFKPANKGYVMYVQPGDPMLRALIVPQTIIDLLMGRKADDYNEEVVSIVATMQAKGLSPFDLSAKTGWLKLYKTGEGINTRYHAEPALVEAEDETKDGRKIKYMADLEASVNPHILEDFDISEVPDVVKFEKSRAWTVEESQAFVKALGTIEGVPQRFLKSAGGPAASAGEESSEASAPEVEDPNSGQYETVAEGDVPY